MGGTYEGGRLAAETNKAKHGDDFFKRIGAKGGAAKTKGPKGFAARPDIARKAGAIGGRIGSRGRKLSPEQAEEIKLRFKLERGQA